LGKPNITKERSAMPDSSAFNHQKENDERPKAAEIKAFKRTPPKKKGGGKLRVQLEIGGGETSEEEF